MVTDSDNWGSERKQIVKCGAGRKKALATFNFWLTSEKMICNDQLVKLLVAVCNGVVYYKAN